MKPLGKPVNNQIKSCDGEVNSSCVIWDGPNISMDCLGVQIYQGDSITPIIYNSFKNFCTLLQLADIKQIDSTCIFDLPQPPDTIVELLNLITEKVCEQNNRVKVLENDADLTYSANLPYCLQIKSDQITITRLPLDEYMEVLAAKMCEEIASLEPLKDELDSSAPSQIYTDLALLETQIQAVCNPVIPEVMEFCTSPLSVQIVSANEILPPTLPTFVEYVTATPHNLTAGDLIYIQGISPDIYNFQMAPVFSVTSPTSFLMEPVVNPHSPGPIPPASLSGAAYVVPVNSVQVEDAYARLEKAFCSFQNYTGTPQELEVAIARDCPNLGNLPRLSNTGTMNTIYGWIDNPVNVGQSMNNLWLTICDMRSALRGVIRNCCLPAPCFSFDIGFRLEPDPAGAFVRIYFQELYTPPVPYFPYYLSNIYDISRTEPIYTGGAVPSWFAFNFPDLDTVTITLTDGSGIFTFDTGLTPMQLMSLPGGYYDLAYPAGFDLSAPVKSVTVSFDYSYTNLITNVTSAGTQVTYTTAVDHVFQVGDKVDVYGVNPVGYNNTNMTITAVTANTFTVTSTFFGAPYVADGGAILSYKTNTTERNCQRCKCCCTFSLTNGLY
jgi:hypothetical protein